MPEDDIIISNNLPRVIIHGGAGNDYITSIGSKILF
jgi:hypothetical protein